MRAWRGTKLESSRAMEYSERKRNVLSSGDVYIAIFVRGTEVMPSVQAEVAKL
jgi:hypothetical protein